MVGIPVKFSVSGIIYGSPCVFIGFLLGVDGVNDPTITFYNGTTVIGDGEVFPTTPFDASTLDPKGFMPGGMEIDCPNGLYVQVSATMGTGEAIAYVRPI